MKDDILLAELFGEIDHHSAASLRIEIDAALRAFRTRHLVLDYSKVEFMDSSGLGLILGRFNKASEIGTEFTLLNPAENVCKILDVAGIGRMIKIERKR